MRPPNACLTVPAKDWIQSWVQWEGQLSPNRGLSCARSTKLLLAHNPELSRLQVSFHFEIPELKEIVRNVFLVFILSHPLLECEGTFIILRRQP